MLMCEVLEVGVSSYYAWRVRPHSERQTANRELMEWIEHAWQSSRKTYGSPRMHRHLNAEGVACGKHRVARLMRESGLVARPGRAYKPQTTDSAHALPVAANLLDQDFSASKPNQKWVADITFIATCEGWLYLAVVLDVFSRMIVGWAMSEYCNAELVSDALNMAQARRLAQAGIPHLRAAATA